MILYIIIFLIINISYVLTNSKENIINELSFDINRDYIIDKISILENVNSRDRILLLSLSNKNLKAVNIRNKKAIPNYQETYLSCNELFIDSLGFYFTIESGNGNNYISRKFFFKYYENDIVLYKIKEFIIYEHHFINEENTIYFQFENVNEYDSKYSIYNFDYKNFW